MQVILRTDIWTRGWLSSQDLALVDNQEQIWEQYLEKLRRAHVRLKETTNELFQAWNKEGGEYNVKLGYMAFQSPLANEGV